MTHLHRDKGAENKDDEFCLTGAADERLWCRTQKKERRKKKRKTPTAAAADDRESRHNVERLCGVRRLYGVVKKSDENMA